MKVRARELLESLLQPRDGGGFPPALLDVFCETGALLRGHFRLQSGLHSEYFVRAGQLAYRRSNAALIAQHMAGILTADLAGPDDFAVLTSANSSGLIGRACADGIGKQLLVSSIDAFRRPTGHLEQGLFKQGQKIAIVTDVVTTGSSLACLVSRAAESGAEVIFVAAFVALNANGFKGFLNKNCIRGRALLEATWPSMSAADCPQCKEEVPLLQGFEFN